MAQLAELSRRDSDTHALGNEKISEVQTHVTGPISIEKNATNNKTIAMNKATTHKSKSVDEAFLLICCRRFGEEKALLDIVCREHGKIPCDQVFIFYFLVVSPILCNKPE
jgi:hypothetical protein